MEASPIQHMRARRDAGPAAMLAVGLLTLLVEFALVERKYAVVGGGFGSSRTIDTPAEIAVFGLVLIACHGLLVAGLYRLVRASHGRLSRRPVFLFNFVLLVPAVGIAVLAAKFSLLSYFSDAIGFQVIRNLGGGSLADAFLYVLSEAGLIALALAAAGVAYGLALLAFRRVESPRWLTRPPRSLGWRGGFGIAAALVALLLAANQVGDVRHALGRFNAWWLASTALHQLTDLDRDGYSFFSHRIDRHPFDPRRHPLALDVPNNGIDEDGLAGDLVLVPEPAALVGPVVPHPRRHVVLVVLESVRGDVIGKRIAGRAVAPNLEALARSGTSVGAAYSHAGFTTLSLKTLFTGEIEPVGDRRSLFRDFAANGYRIAVLSGQSEDFGDISETVGMQRHAAIFADAGTLKERRALSFAAQGSLLVDGTVLIEEFDRRLGAAEGWSQPTFLYVNIQSAHFPYHHPGMPQLLPGKPIPRASIRAGNRDWVERTYWNAVAHADLMLGRLIARLKAAGVQDDTLIVVTADHGESLFDDGFLGHGHMINRQQTHVPLVFSDPGIGVDGPVGLADVRAILLGALGVKVPPAPRHPLLQYVGSLDAPSSIGTVEPDGAVVTFDLDRDIVRFGDEVRAYRDLAENDRLKRRADRLVREWGRQRWLAHLARSGEGR